MKSHQQTRTTKQGALGFDTERNTQPWEMPLLGKTALRGERKQRHHHAVLAGCTQDTPLANERMHDMAGLEAEGRILSSDKTSGVLHIAAQRTR